MSDSWSGCVPWGIGSPKEMPSVFEREWMPQGACPGRDAPTPILDQALSQRDGIERVLDELRERDDVEGAEVSRAEDHRRRDPCDERLAPS